MRMFTTVAVAAGLSVALIWLPMPGVWWLVARCACYLPIVLVSTRHGPVAGLLAGLAASMFYAFVAVWRGMGDFAWINLFVPDLAVVGLLGGRLAEIWPHSKPRYSGRTAYLWPPIVWNPEPEISIDLNAIASIQSAAGLLAEDDTSTDQRQELVGIISTECEHLSASIATLVRKDRSAASLETREADLGPIIEASVREAEFVLCGRGIVVRKQIAPDLPPVQCNPDQIRELLMSLIMNGIQSAPPGNNLILNAHCGDDGVILEVKDQGRGLFLSQVARRFFGPRQIAARVGLAAAYDIVRQHGGRIEASVNTRRGMEFSVWLPPRGKRPNGGWQGTGGGG